MVTKNRFVMISNGLCLLFLRYSFFAYTIYCYGNVDQQNAEYQNTFHPTAYLYNQSSNSQASFFYVEPTNQAGYFNQQEQLLRCSIQYEMVDRFLKKCTKQEFKTYLGYQNISTTKELVAHTEWWKYPVFWDHVESLPDGHEQLVHFAQEFAQDYESFWSRVFGWFSGEYKTDSRTMVEQKIEQHNARYEAKQEERRQQQEREYQQKLIHDQIHQHFIMDYQQVMHITKVWQASDNRRWQKRATVLSKKENWYYAEHNFRLTPTQQQYCMLNDDQLGISLYGNGLQKQLHQELLDCIDSAVPLYNDTFFTSCISLAQESNRAGFVHKAVTMVDFCYAIKDGVMDGTGKFLCNTYQMVFHPIDTVLGTIKAAYTVVQALGKVAKIPVELTYYYAVDQEQFYTRCEDIVKYNQALYNVAADYVQKTSGSNITRDATSLMTELVLTDRFMHLTVDLCAGFAQKIPAILEACAAELVESEFVPIGVPGLKVEKAQLFAKEKQAEKIRYGGDIATAVTDLEKELAAVKKMQEFFEERKFGQFLKKYCERIGQKYDNQSMYRITKDLPGNSLKKGDIFYLDGLHKNHLEVFRGSGKVKQTKTVLNFDGTINHKKAEQSVNQGRTITIG